MKDEYNNKYPYQLCEIRTRNGDLNKRWYVEFYAWDISKNRLVRKPQYVSSKLKTAKERMAALKQAKKEIDKELINGAVLGAQKPEKSFVKKGITSNSSVRKALEYAIRLKKQVNGVRSAQAYQTLSKHFFDWFDRSYSSRYKIGDFNVADANKFFDYLLIEKNFSNITHNNNLQFLKALFNMLVNREIIMKSPCKNIKYLKTKSKAHQVYSDDQRKKIKEELIKKDPQMFLYINFIYYTFVRPKELRFAQVKQIQGSRFLVPGSIYWNGEKIPVNKNGKSQYVVIPTALQQLIQEYDICNQDPDTFIFSASLHPDKDPVGPNFFNTRYREIMNELGIPRNHTAYAWKHTGVCKLYQQIKDPKAVQDQCRHADLKTTIVYLRDLGMFENNEVEEKFPSF